MATKQTPPNPAAAFGDLSKLFDAFRMPTLDMQALAESQRKDMEALAQATRQAYDGMQALVTRRDELMKETLAQWQSAMQAGTGGVDAMAGQVERLQQNVTKAVSDLRELAEIEARTRQDVWQTLQQRMQQNFADMTKMMTPR